jgi:hypothetical protein
VLQNNGKAGKKSNGDADGGAPRSKKLGAEKKAVRKGRTVTFRFPHTVLDYHITYRMLCLLYM